MARKRHKAKRGGFGLEVRSFTSKDGKTRYIVYRTKAGSFHVFAEVEAKQAAVRCGAGPGNTRQQWQSIWPDDE